MKALSVINENTLIPIGLVITLFGGVVWLTQLHVQTNANAAILKDIQAQQAEYTRNLEQIHIELAEIKNELKHLGVTNGN